MKFSKIIGVISALIIFSFSVNPVLAQDYYFAIPNAVVDVYVESDGSFTFEYAYEFQNQPGAHAIDYVDIGLPNSTYSLNRISAEVDGVPVFDIEKSPVVSPGIAVGLGNLSIPAGQSGVVYIRIEGMRNLLFTADQAQGQNETYTSFQFQPNFYEKTYVAGQTHLTVNLHLPPGITEQEKRFFIPQNWPCGQEPLQLLDTDQRHVYQWSCPNASSAEKYIFGAAFPARLVPEGMISTTNTLTFNPGEILAIAFPLLCCGGFLGLIVLVIVLSIKSAQKRRLKYLPPKIALEGHGIKRGLTAVEAAILMEEPMDKILTMILFSTIKKQAASIIKNDPLEIKIEEQLPEELHDYEKSFLLAFKNTDARQRRTLLQDVMVTLVKTVGEKMKGFSAKETVAYYKEIIKQAWSQVEQAGTPEVRAEKYGDNVDWTMLDGDYQERTKRVFGSGDVYMPWWWWRVNPGLGRTTTTTTIPTGTTVARTPTLPSSKSTTISLPKLPGSDAAASVVRTAQSFAAGILGGNVASFTSGVTSKTNPVPQPSASTYRSGGKGGGGGFSGHSCACACACAGCACACAGGGR